MKKFFGLSRLFEEAAEAAGGEQCRGAFKDPVLRAVRGSSVDL